MSVGETRVVSSTGGEKGIKLARYDLIPAGALRQVAELYGKGAQKYEDHNWRRGYDWSLSFAALMRHAWAFWEGEDLDEDPQIPLGEDGERSPHLAAVVFHALALLTFMEEHPEFDNRPSTINAQKREALQKRADYAKKLASPTELTREERFRLVAAAYGGADPILAGIYKDTFDEFKKREPRVWDSILDVPPNTPVKGTRYEGARYFWDGSNESDMHFRSKDWRGGAWFKWGTIRPDFDAENGPFTEILEEDK